MKQSHFWNGSDHVDALDYTEANRKWTAYVREKMKQRLLLAGMDCLAGQQDLFPTDGEIDKARCGLQPVVRPKPEIS
jgi:hypothetical protein